MKYDIHLQLDEENTPLFKRTRTSKEEQPAIQQAMDLQRRMGAKNIDLWVQGSIYPRDPLSQLPPQFSGLTSFLKYVCEGTNGLWGYLCRLGNQPQQIYMHMQRMLHQKDIEIAALKVERDRKATECQGLQDVVHDMTIQNTELTQSIDGLQRMLRSTRSHTHLGLRERVRNLKPMEDLTIGSGQWKRRIKACKKFNVDMLNANEVNTCVAKVLTKNMVKSALQSKKFKTISDEIKRDCVEKVGASFTPMDAQGICDQVGLSEKSYATIYKQMDAGFSKVFTRKRVLPLPRPMYVRQARKRLNTEILERIGEPYHITYSHVYYVPIVEAPTQISKQPGARGRPRTNARGPSNDVSGAPSNQSASRLKEVRFELHERNNFVLRLERLQSTMVQFYDMTQEECNGILKFVIKLDESEIVKGQKMERVSITLMNRALDPRVTPKDPKYFSVQSENDIWWLAAFEVAKEDHGILKAFFNLTEIPDVIRRQSNGEKLHVDGYGDFTVEWHLAGDLKTLKCMYGVSNAANAKFPCLYCMHGRTKESSGRNVWDNGIGNNAAPSRDGMLRVGGDWVPKDVNWDPILPIPLSRVHFCTLHAFVRIVEKIVYAYICFAYTMQPKEESERACKELEKVLSEIGLHGGNVHIKKDEKKSGATGDIPCKPCFGGAKARNFFSAPRNEQGEVITRFPQRFDGWKKVHYAVPDRTNNGTTRIAKARVWLELNSLALLLQKLSFEASDADNYKTAVDAFYNAMANAWGAHNITPYMHILKVHGPYFAKEGSLAIWSTQGMERSHWQARCGFQRATDHGGGRGIETLTEDGSSHHIASNPMVQMLQWWYRRLEIRFQKKTQVAANVDDTIAMDRLARKRAIYTNSSARERHAVWRQDRLRVGRRWLRAEVVTNDA